MPRKWSGSDATYGWRKVETQTNGTRDGTLPCPIGTKYHVQVWARSELYGIVGHKVLELYAHDGAGDEATRQKYASVTLQGFTVRQNVPISVPRQCLHALFLRYLALVRRRRVAIRV